MLFITRRDKGLGRVKSYVSPSPVWFTKYINRFKVGTIVSRPLLTAKGNVQSL